MEKQTSKILSAIGIYAFGVLGIAALGGALFAGATHQIFIALICGIITTTSIVEIRKEKAKQ